MGRAPATVTPAEARFGAATMLCLTILALITAGAVYQATSAWREPLLFVGLAAIGAWQVSYYWKHH